MFWLCWLLIGGLALDNFLQWRKIGNLRKEIDMLHDANRLACDDIKYICMSLKTLEIVVFQKGVANNDR